MTINPSGTLKVYYQCQKGKSKAVLCDTYRTEVSAWYYEKLPCGGTSLRVNKYPSKLVGSTFDSTVNLELNTEAVTYKTVQYFYLVKIEVEYDE